MPSSADAKTPNTTQQYYKSKHQLLSNIFEPFAACASHKHGKRIEKKKNKNNNNNKIDRGIPRHFFDSGHPHEGDFRSCPGNASRYAPAALDALADCSYVEFLLQSYSPPRVGPKHCPHLLVRISQPFE
mmetsp:Transcript_7660/g.15882  ORF Transcript_7660/g.15882 Transcript_7660/m.15882 type:complete len:129 (-) Transcript_7660:1169-1555(-)